MPLGLSRRRSYKYPEPRKPLSSPPIPARRLHVASGTSTPQFTRASNLYTYKAPTVFPPTDSGFGELESKRAGPSLASFRSQVNMSLARESDQGLKSGANVFLQHGKVCRRPAILTAIFSRIRLQMRLSKREMIRQFALPRLVRLLDLIYRPLGTASRRFPLRAGFVLAA